MTTYTAEVVIKESGADAAAAKIHAVGDAATHAHGPTDALRHGVDMLKEAFIVLGLSMSLEKIVEMADSYLVLQKRLGQVTTSAEEQQAVWAKLNTVANEHSQSIDGVTNMYVSLMRQAGQYKISSEQIMGVINSISALLQANGRTADDVNGAMRRLAAGMAQGSVSGRTMLTLFTQFPELMEGISKASGRSQQAIKILAENGSISMRQLMQWVEQAGGTISHIAPHTDEVGEAMIRLKNSLTNAVGELDKVGAGSALLSKFLDNTAITVTVLAKGITILILAFGKLSEQMQHANAIIDQHLGWMRTLMNILVPAAGIIDNVGKAWNRLTGDADHATKSEHAVTGALQQTETASGTVLRQVNSVATAHRTAGQAAAQHGSQIQNLNGALQQHNAQLHATSQAHQEVSGQITVTRGALDGFTKTVYDSNGAISDTPVQLQRTRSTMDEFGNTTRTVTQSIRDLDGSVTAMKRTVETFKDGVRTVSQYIIDLNGNIKLESQSVEEATVKLNQNSIALSKNAEAMAAVTSGADSAAAAYSRMGAASAAAGSGGGGGGYQGVGSFSMGTSDKDIEYMKQLYGQFNSIIGWGGGRGPISDPAWWAKHYNDNGSAITSPSASGGGSSLQHYAGGADFMVGGNGGTDQNLVAFMASRGERVKVETTDQQNKGSSDSRGGPEICVYMTVNGVQDVSGFRKSQTAIATQLADQIHRSESQLRRSVR
jgi:tape measure domain-containing protein